MPAEAPVLRKASRQPMEVFERLESQVRSYIRAFPTVFTVARGAFLWDVRGRRYIDFFAGAGALNYGHNEPRLKEALLRYLAEDGVAHALDMGTAAKAEFLETLESLILEPRGLPYRVMFPGPTGTNAVEAALKLARKVTGRAGVVGFTHGFHGMTLGALAASGNRRKRRAAGLPLQGAVAMPYDGFLGGGVDTVAVLRRYLEDDGSGLDRPAAVLVETVQGEGGVDTGSEGWLRRLAALCREHGVLLIVDDIQVGCGRTGPFFSFEPAGLRPDMVCLSKSISGFGLPMSLLLVRPELDVWEPGEHNGTFRGNTLAFVTATAALRAYWSDGRLSREVARKAAHLERRLAGWVEAFPGLRAEVRGRGLIQGLACPEPGVAEAVCRKAFERGLVVETSGAEGRVVKILPPLVIDDADLEEGCAILERCLADSA
jgi:diaminobutyrate-2-oxoglutarate transaminase